MSRYIRCKFCKWKVPAFTTTSRKKRVHNYHLLQKHCVANHDEKMKKFGLLLYEDDEFDQFSNNLIERR